MVARSECIPHQTSLDPQSARSSQTPGRQFTQCALKIDNKVSIATLDGSSGARVRPKDAISLDTSGSEKEVRIQDNSHWHGTTGRLDDEKAAEAQMAMSVAVRPNSPTRRAEDQRAGQKPLYNSNRSNVAEGSWQCPLCSKKNEQTEAKCLCCGRAREMAESAAKRLWAGPSDSQAHASAGTKLSHFQKKLPDVDETSCTMDDDEKHRRYLNRSRRPPPTRPPPPHATVAYVLSHQHSDENHKKRRPQRPPGPPPSHAVSERVLLNSAHTVHTKHFTSHFHDGDQHKAITLKERDRRLEKKLYKTSTGSRPSLSDPVVLSELCTLGGVPCAVTVVQREWRAIIHAVDLERGDEYSASSDLHARFVDAAAPSEAQKLNLYRDLVAACAFKSTLATKTKSHAAANNVNFSSTKALRRLIVKAPCGDSLLAKLTKAQAKHERRTPQQSELTKIRERTGCCISLVLADEQLLIGDILMRVSAMVREPPAAVQVQLEDPTTHIKSSLIFPLGAAVGLAATLQNKRRPPARRTDSHKIVHSCLALSGNDSASFNSHASPWAAAAARRAALNLAKNHQQNQAASTNLRDVMQLFEPAAYRTQIAMAVEFVCSELTPAAEQENLEEVHRIKPSASLVAAIADACRKNRAAVIAQAAVRSYSAKRRVKCMHRQRAAAERAATKLQALLRGTISQRKFKRRLTKREKIRRAWSKYGSRVQGSKYRAATRITTACRAFMARERGRVVRANANDSKRARIVVSMSMAEQCERRRVEARLLEIRKARAQVYLQRWARRAATRRRIFYEAKRAYECHRRVRAAMMLSKVAHGALKRMRAADARRRLNLLEVEQRDACRYEAALRIQLALRCAKARQLFCSARRDAVEGLAAKCIAIAWKHRNERRAARVILEGRRHDLLIRARKAAELAAEGDETRRQENFKLRARQKAREERIVATVLAERTASDASAFAKLFASRALRAVKIAREEHKSQAASTIAAAYRRARMKQADVVRRKLRVASTIRIQNLVRRAQAKRRAAQERQRLVNAANLIQRVGRGRAVRLRAAESLRRTALLRMAVTLQSLVRREAAIRQRITLAAERNERRHHSVTVIQLFWRRALAAARTATRLAEIQVQVEARAAQKEKEAWQLWGACVIQSWWRARVAARSAQHDAAWVEWAVAVIQIWWRNRMVMREKGTGAREPQQSPTRAVEDADEDENFSDSDEEPFEFDPMDRHDVHEAFQWARHGRKDKLRKFCEGGFDVSPPCTLQIVDLIAFCQVDMRNEFNQTLAMVAAQNNNKGVLKLLHRYGVSINDVDFKGNTALHYATKYGYYSLAEYMVRKLGADDGVTNNQGATCYLEIRGAE